MRGINIGHVKDMKLGLNTVMVLVDIKSTSILIPKKSIIETTQTGILKDAVIDIIPLEKIDFHQVSNINHFSSDCYKSKILCNYHHLYGERGINYDDLIRATTRISQRFDDPRFFSLCYLLLQKLAITSCIIQDFTCNLNQFVFLISSYLNHHFAENQKNI